ncbi:class I adenylate-forming enzyme family protein [Actinophytocola sp.]|uniref:class I adenylate-forming enzyme family protein n=1 Tax=Actinophytocola sp. TaxID=1872138 RepID=UPI003D6B848D
MWKRNRDDAFPDRFLHAAVVAPERAAVVLDGELLNYGDLADEAVLVARGLVARGVAPGDAVGVLAPTSRCFLVSLLGAALAGVRVVPINTRFRRRELSFVIAKAELSVLITTSLLDAGLDLVALLHSALPDLKDHQHDQADFATAPQLRAVVGMGMADLPGIMSGDRFYRDAESVDPQVVRDRFEQVSRDDVAVVSFTSGTTSNPKGCLIRHGSMVEMWDASAARLGIRERDVCWIPSPMFHAAGYGGVGVLAGVKGTVLTQSHFQPAEAARLMAEHRPRIWYSPFPPVTDAVVEAAPAAGYDLGTVEAAVYVAQTPERFDWLSAKLSNAGIVQPYGLTESTLFVTLGDPAEAYDVRKSGTGQVFHRVEMRLIDPETGSEANLGDFGEIQFRGFNAFIGYLSEPELTAATLLDGGWVRTGDLGRINEFGQLQCVGRLKDMLKVGGENVSALEVEAHLQTHPAIKLAQVVAAPDERLQEVPCAYVELEAGHDLTADDVVAHCTGEIARYKIPRYVRFVDSWPMSTTKIRKAELRGWIAAEVAEQGEDVALAREQ